MTLCRQKDFATKVNFRLESVKISAQAFFKLEFLILYDKVLNNTHLELCCKDKNETTFCVQEFHVSQQALVQG